MRHDDIISVLRAQISAHVGLEVKLQIEKLTRNAELMRSWQNDKIAALEGNIRRLERQVENLSAAINVTSEDRQSGRDIVGEPILIIAAKVAEMTGVSVKRILSRSRFKRDAHARQLVMYMASKAGYSSPVIGRALGRDHSSVLSGIRREADRRAARAAANGPAG